MSLKGRIMAFFLAFSMIPVGHAFTDVHESDRYATAMLSLKEDGIVTGYEDGSFHPFQEVSRAEFAVMAANTYFQIPRYELKEDCFTDVPRYSWFAPHVCYLQTRGVISGYKDGTFKPTQTVTLVEASKMLSELFQLSQSEDPTGEAWYDPYLADLEQGDYLLPSFYYVGQALTRSEVAELLYRIKNDPERNNGATADGLSRTPCEPFHEKAPDNVDIAEIRDQWIDWYNEERALVGAKPLRRHPHLDFSSYNWSEVAEARGTINHTRPGSSAYYDYFGIMTWFSQQFGIYFEGRGGSTYGESIAYNYYTCDDQDCTEELTDAVAYSFNFFASEKGQAYRPHYDMMVNKNYEYIGLGVVVDESRNKFWLTTHLATDVQHEGLPFCA